MAPTTQATRPLYIERGQDIIGYGAQFPDGTVVLKLPHEEPSVRPDFATAAAAVRTHHDGELVYGAPGLVVIERAGLEDIIDRWIIEETDIREIDRMMYTESLLDAIEAAQRVNQELPDGSIDTP